MDDPPRFTLFLDRGDVRLSPWTACVGNGCFDGSPPDELESVASAQRVEFGFDIAGWDFEATFREIGKKCPRMITVPARKTSDRTFVVEPAGLAGKWDVDLFGRGPGGDAITTFRWNTPRDGTMPQAATGSAAVLAGHDGELDSYGVEVGVSDLAVHPEHASATVQVTSSQGKGTTIDTRWERGCYNAGSLWFTASDDEGRRAAALGEGPFSYTVKLTLDGTTYTGRGTWPDGEIEDNEPNVALTWTPVLPVYTGRSPVRR